MPRAKKDISKDLMFQKIMPSADLSGKKDEDEAEAVIDDISQAPKPADAPPPPLEVSAAVAEPPIPYAEDIHEYSKATPSVEAPMPAPVSTPPIHIHQPPPPKINQSTTPPPTMAQQIAARTIDFSSDGEGYLVNTMEKLVFDNLETILSRFKCCKCDRCKKDILALTLNSLPPKYIVATKDKPPLPCRDSQVVTEVTTALVRAVIKVKNEPRH